MTSKPFDFAGRFVEYGGDQIRLTAGDKLPECGRLHEHRLNRLPGDPFGDNPFKLRRRRVRIGAHRPRHGRTGQTVQPFVVALRGGIVAAGEERAG